MAQRKYLILYKDGSKRHVDREVRDSMMLCHELEQVGHNRYRCTLPVRTLHSFAELSSLSFQSSPIRRFIEGRFTIERKGRRWTELLETPEALAYRLERQGQLCSSIS